MVTFTEVGGLKDLNSGSYKIKILGPYTFSIGDVTKFGQYTTGGYVTQVKQPKTLNFVRPTQIIFPQLTIIYRNLWQSLLPSLANF